MTSPLHQPGPVVSRVAWTIVPAVFKAVGRLAWRLEMDLEGPHPPPPFVVASNHHSFLDPLVIAASLGGPIRFLGLVDLLGNYRWLDAALGVFEMIPLRRGVVPLGPIRTALVHLSGGGVVGLFPEATRHWDFQPDRARPGAAWLATRAGVPLVPVAIAGTERVLGVDNRLRSGRIRVAVGPPLHPEGSDREAIDELTRCWAVWVAAALRRSVPPGGCPVSPWQLRA